MPILPNTFTEIESMPSTFSNIPEVPSTWLVNPQGVIDTWDNANRIWDSAYTWDGTTSQTTNAVPSSWSEI